MFSWKRENIKRLCEKVNNLSISARNQERIKRWGHSSYVDQWRGLPPEDMSRGIPITVGLEYAMWAKVLNFDIKRYHTEGRTYLEARLRKKIYEFTQFQDDTPIDETIDIWLGSPFELSLFGLMPVYVADTEPWIPRTPIIHKEEDLDRLPYPDFYTSGLMPQAHQMYEEIKKLVEKEGFSVGFPTWMRGPFGAAAFLRGMENLLVDMKLNPEFVHKLMRFIVDSRKKWFVEKAKFLDASIEKGILDNDDVNSPMLSPELYKEFVLPYEKELCAFHGGISYWHSCGDITPLLKLIREIPEIDMLHVGPVTHLETAVNVFKDTPIEKCLHPLRDVQEITEQQMEYRLKELMQEANGVSVTFRADAIQILHSMNQELVKIKLWISTAQHIVKP